MPTHTPARSREKTRRLVSEDTRAGAAAWADRAAWIERQIGKTSRTRLTWLLERFLRADLSRASDREWGEWRVLLGAYSRSGSIEWISSPRPTKDTVVTARSKRHLEQLSPLNRHLLETGMVSSVVIKQESWTANPEERAEIAQCQTMLAGYLAALAGGRLCPAQLGDVLLIARIGPDQLNGPGPFRLHRVFRGSLFASVLLTTLDLLGDPEVLELDGRPRLRSCELTEPTSSARCGRLFLMAKRQRFCSREHTARAMYLQWRAKGSPRGSRSEPERQRRATP